jgi:hypothetical protein
MLRYVIAFIAGGTAFTILAPILSSIAILMIIGLIILAILTAFIPGGWVIMFGFRSLIGFFRRWIMPLTILTIAALFITVLTGTAGHDVGLLSVVCISGGLGLQPM